MAVGKKDYKDSEVRLRHKQKVPPQTLVKVEPSSDDTRTRAELLDAIEDLFQTVYTSTGASREVDLEDLRAILTMLVLSATNADDDGVGATQTQVDAINLNSTNIARNASDLATFISNISISNNKIGIGTTSPLKNFEVEWISNNTVVDSGEGLGGGAAGSGVLIQNGSYVTNTYANLDFRAGTADGRIAYKYNSINDGDFHFITDDGNNPETKLFIKNNGKVGIGTTSPSQGLHVVDAGIITSEFESSDNVSSLIEVSNNAGLDVFFGVYGGNLVLRHDDYTADHFAIDSSGNVGIGTASPSATLHISDASNSGVTSLSVNDRVKVRGDGVVQWGSAANYGLLSWDTNQARVGALSGSNLAIFSNGSEKMRIDTSGNVGIGTTSPQAKLQIQDGDLYFKNDSYGDDNRIGFGNPARNGDAAFIDYIGNGDFRGSLAFGVVTTASNTAATEIVRFDKSGNVGIGTTSPGELLEVYKDGGDVAIKIHEDAGTHEARLHLRRGGSDWELINNNDLAIESEGTERFRIKTSGNVGIGTSSPSEKLEINGNIKVGDSDEVRFGADNDLRIYHNGTNSNIENFTGTLQIVQTVDDEDITFRCDDGSGGTTPYLTLDGSATRTNVHKDLRFDDNIDAHFGAGSDMILHHNGTDNFIQSFNGDLKFIQYADDKDIIFQSDNGSGGVSTYFFLDGSNSHTNFQLNARWVDNAQAQFGNSGDLKIYHDGSTSYIDEVGTGDLVLNTNGASIKLLFNGTEFMGQFVANGAARLYYDNSKKLETTSTGVEVTGNISLTGSVQRQISTTHHTININSSTGSSQDFWIPFIEKNEQPSPNVTHKTVAPYDGVLKKVIVHSTAAFASNAQIRFHRINNGAAKVFANDNSTDDVTTNVTADMSTAYTSVAFNFISGNTFSAGDQIGLGIVRNNLATGDVVITAVWEYELF